MKTPDFVKLALGYLVTEIVLVVLLPMFGHLALLALLFVIPMRLSSGAVQGSLDWLKEREPEKCRWTAVAKSMCGAGLIFLVLNLLLACWPPPGQEDIWGILAFLFLLLQLLRFCGGALFTVVLSVPTILMSKSRLGKLSGASAFLSSLGGLAFFRELFAGPDVSAGLARVGVQNGGADMTFVVVFFTLGFLYAMVWGGVVQWAAAKWHDE